MFLYFYFIKVKIPAYDPHKYDFTQAYFGENGTAATVLELSFHQSSSAESFNFGGLSLRVCFQPCMYSFMSF